MKPPDAVRAIGVVPSFRTHRSAAPLKPGTYSATNASGSPFPHSPECGPIEATGTPLRSSATSFFPHSPECGPIEALMFTFLRPIPASFPHSPECGPIEAVRCRASAGDGSSPFRTHRSAAPLKPSVTDVPSGFNRTFRTHRSAAPLKHFALALASATRITFPHSPECGPIEAS